MPAAAPVLYKLPAARPVLYKRHISPRRWNVLLACQFGRMIAPQAPRTVAIAPPTVCKSFVHHVSLTQYTTTSPHHNPSKIIPSIKITSSPSRCTTGDAPVVLTDTRGRAWPSENGQRLKNPSMCARKARALFRLFLLAITFVVMTVATPTLQYSTAWEKKTWKDGTRQAYVHVKIGGALPGQGHCTKKAVCTAQNVFYRRVTTVWKIQDYSDTCIGVRDDLLGTSRVMQV